MYIRNIFIYFAACLRQLIYPNETMDTVKILFWLALALVFYTYLGYGMVLFAAVRIKRLLKARPAPTLPEDSRLPDVTLLICAYNEEDVVGMKMENIRHTDYPKDKLHIVWATDGSTDRTNELLGHYPEVRIMFKPERRGKTAAMNRAMAGIDTDIVIMTDANTMTNPGAIKEIVRLFQDPTVGCVAGEKRVKAREEGQAASEGEGLYWKYESTLKKWDNELYSAMGAAGELCAVRRSCFTEIPEDTLLDDFILSMNIVGNGLRIAYAPEAYAMEYGSADMTEEAKRKTRIAAGGLQSIWRLRRLMNPLRHPAVAFQFVSHRVLRWSITPVALMALIPLNTMLVFAKAGWIYTLVWMLQILFYSAAFGGYLYDMQGKKNRILYMPYYFLFMNINVFRGVGYLMKHRNTGVWEKAKRG